MVSARALPRIGTARQADRPTLGEYVADVGERMGFPFHEWQRHLSDVSCELIPRTNWHDGQSTQRFNYQYVGAMVGRQSGKSAWSAARIVAQCLMPNHFELIEPLGIDAMRPQHIVYTAQSRTNAVARWLEHIAIMESSPWLQDEIAQIRYATGREVIEFRNGSTYRPVTPNRTGARGLTLDLAIVDEALAHPLWLLAVLRPTMAQRDGATGCIGAQFVVISNAGDDDSELLNRMQELGIASLGNADARRAWFEWSAHPDSDPYDESVWYSTMPTLGEPNGIEIEFLRMEAETLREDQFSREYLCRRSVATTDAVIPFDLWMDCYQPHINVPFDHLTLGLDVRWDRMGASLVACGQVDQFLPLEVIECRQGLDWIVARTAEVARKWSAPVALDTAGPSANFVDALQREGVQVVELTTPDVTQAAASFYDATFAKRTTHLNGYQLNDAIRGASRRAVGQRWAFDRKGHVDISPLIAATFALYVCERESGNRPAIYF